MIDSISQVRDIGGGVIAFVPHSEESQTKAKSLKLNQLVRQKTTTIGAVKQRSVAQLNLLMAACQYVANNLDDQHWNTKEKVKFQLKVLVDFRDPDTVIVTPKGDIHFLYRSFAFANLKHMEACNVFERCYDAMAGILKMDVDTFIAAVKSEMRQY